MITKEQVIKELNADSEINKARMALRFWILRINACQNSNAQPLTIRGLEFEAVMDIYNIMSCIGPSVAEKESRLGWKEVN